MSAVLLVEDEPLIAELIEDVLRDHGLDVVLARSGTEAYMQLDGEHEPFAAVITDINLGGAVTGFDIARRARELNPAVWIAYMTGLPSNIYAAEAGALVFPKPFDVEDMADQVTSLIEQQTRLGEDQGALPRTR